MRRYPVYAIMALVFIGITKLLQVTAFDYEQYGEYKRKSEKSMSEKAKRAEKPSTSKEELESLEKEQKSYLQETKEKSTEEGNEIQVEDLKNQFPDSQDADEYPELSSLKNDYLKSIINSLPSGQLREDVVIRYYRHEKDGNKVDALKDLGYYIHEKKATETAGLGSNVLIYGENVTTEDIKIVAYTLIDQGLPLKAIYHTQFEWKSTSLEIGTDTLLTEDSILSPQDISNFKK